MGNQDRREKISLFVPGRLCLFGEHSDWAGMHRMLNSDVLPGYAIVSGVEEGIYATAERDTKFIVESDLPIFKNDSFECEMDTDKLLCVARQGGFFSYVAGVASYINDNYSVGGVRIKITDMDLPIKSGLSSSAAVCVLVARAFNQLYHLKMNTQGEMMVAYNGEHRTPSRCGRLDQACAYGVKPVYMEFDGIEINSRSIELGGPFYWLVADLNASKDTVKILADLNKCYPFACNEKEEQVHRALGEDNKEIVEQAVEFLQRGDAEKLGLLMRKAQENFDLKVMPACVDELTAPVLHSLLDDPMVKELTYGAKGVGSQGDGTIQFLCKDIEAREQLIQYLSTEKKMKSFKLTLNPGQSIKRAIIPVAGFGTRLYPTTRGMKKDMLPILDKDGMLKPALLILLEQLDEAGIEEICLVIGEQEIDEYNRFFSRLSDEHIGKLGKEIRNYEDKIVKLGEKITYVFQKERLGLGHAIYQCRAFTKGEPVLVLLGDMIYKSAQKENCTEQIIQAFEQCGKSVVSIHEVNLDEVIHYGILYGQWEDDKKDLLKVEQMVEKPSVERARDELGVHMGNNEIRYYSVFGQYVLTPAVFAELEKNIDEGLTTKGEIQLTDALDQVREKYGLYGFVPNGRSYDLGIPEAYRETLINYGLENWS